MKILRKDREMHDEKDRQMHLNLSLVTVQLLSEQLKTLTEEVKILTEQNKKASKQHEKMSEEHTKIAEIIRQQNVQLNTITEPNKTLLEGEAVILKLQGYTNMKERNEEFHSSQFYSHPGGYGMYFSVDANGSGDGNGTHVSVCFTLTKGRYDDQVHWPFLGTVTYELLNQLEDDNHYRAVTRLLVKTNMKVGNSRGRSKFLPHSSLGHNPATNTQYLLNDTLYFRVSVKVDNHKPWLDCIDKVSVDSIKTINNNNTLNNNESMIFKTTNFKETKAAKLAVFTSFYTSSCGYHMRISVSANGYEDGEDTHVSVYTRLIQGCHDNQLHWPFLGTVTYELLNQLRDDNHHNMVNTFTLKDNMKVGGVYGYDKFFPHSSLGHNLATNTQYLLNDTLYFRVSVKVDDHKPWLVCTHQS